MHGNIGPRAWLALASFASALLLPFFFAGSSKGATPRSFDSQTNKRYEKIASTILDSDELLLSLLTHQEVSSRIQSVSNFALDQKLSNVADRAMHVEHIYYRGNAELPLSVGADVVFASPFSDAHAQRLWQSVSIPIIALEPATNLRAVQRNLLVCSEALGLRARGEAVAQWLEQSAQIVRQTTRSVPPRSVLVIQSGYVVGEETLMDDLLRTAGLQNHARKLGVRGHAPVSIAKLAQTPPELIARIELRSDEKRREVAQSAQKRALAALQVEQVDLTPRYSLSTSHYAIYAAVELAREVHGVQVSLPTNPTLGEVL